jgi:hypothetical protein
MIGLIQVHDFSILLYDYNINNNMKHNYVHTRITFNYVLIITAV